MKIKNLPKITVVTPSYNQGKFLRETIESVINQNYPNLEYFIIDGGSTDESVDIIREYEDQIDWWVSEKDKGQSDAINKGFRKASGELLCWVNSDDILLPGCLQEVGSSYLEHGKPELIHSNFIYIDQNSLVARMIRIPRQTRFFMNRGVWSVSAPSSFFSNKLLGEIGYLNVDYHISMDLDIWMKMIKKGARIHYIPKYLGAFRRHQDSKTLKLLKLRKKRDESSEHTRIFDDALPGVSQRNRKLWRLVWKLYQMINLNYLRSFIDLIKVKGKRLKEIY
jgi:glycosyltransferase involved in cell wall biosynthesis